MANNKTGIFALVAGVAAGAAALFLSKKENREMVKKEIALGEKAVGKAARAVSKNTQQYAKKVQAKGKILAKKTAKAVSNVEDSVMKAEKKVIKKFALSPALKLVGKKKS